MVSESADSSDSSPSDEPRSDAPSAVDAPPVGGRWWYWVAAVPLYYVAATVLGFLLGVVAFALAVGGVFTASAGDVTAPLSVGLGFALVVLGALLLAAVGLLVSVAFPLAVYRDATALADADVDWDPDPALYAALGVAGILLQPLQVPVAVYYLFKRHESVGRP
ncbi:hypothetical protein [Halobacterium litoreum]|uniref:Uncharacterized protein n=1 Tax=Halobacterium litoreum TaxID=2039234 RepID=A0ABD5NEB0_9EURY|nr:hypothetical protein [Halobacterium litoreum]UHH13411.1 hypothetical protein LT972_00085 [Halobacterium litoreum]